MVGDFSRKNGGKSAIVNRRLQWGQGTSVKGGGDSRWMVDWQFGQASWGGDPKDGRDIFSLLMVGKICDR